MDVNLDNGGREENFDVLSRGNLLLGEPLLLPRDVLNGIETLGKLSTLREEASTHLKDLKNLTAMCEANEMEIHELQIKVKARENEILKAVLEISMEKRDLCEGEDNEDWIRLDREMAEMESAFSTFENVAAKGMFLSPSSSLTENQKGGKILPKAINYNSRVTGEVPMEIVKECPSGSPVGMPSDGRLVLPKRLQKMQSEESKLLEGEKRAADEMKAALGELQRFSTDRVHALKKVEEKLLRSISEISAAHADLSEKCENPDSINLLAENLLFKRLSLKVLKEVARFAKVEGKVRTKQIELNYNMNLFEPRLKLLKEVKFLTEKRQRCRGSRWTEETGPDFHNAKLVESSAECSFSVDNPAGLDPF